jgi:hypothetical protein
MRIRIWLRFLVFGLMGIGVWSVAAPAQQGTEQGYKIAGRVVNAVTGAAVGGVVVTVADARMPMRRVVATTGEGGEFSFGGLPAGKFTLMGSRAGYATSMYEQHEQFSTAIVTGPDFETDKLVLRLMPLAMITGHVTDEVGEGIRNAAVLLYMEDRSEGITRVTQAGGAKTDDRGYFDIGVLQPGTYYVSATARPWYARNMVRKGGEASPLDVAYPTTFYGGATESDGASALVLKGGDKPDIDIQLRPVPALHVMFPVPVDPPAQPGQGPVFHIPVLRKREFDAAPVPEGVSMRMVEPGMMEMSGVTPGKYEVDLRSSNSREPNEYMDVDLEHDGQSLGLAEATALGELKITLKMPEGEPAPKQYLVLLRDAKEKVVEAHPGDADGVVTFDAVRPGNYGIVIGTPGRLLTVGRMISTAGTTAGAQVSVTAGAKVEVTAEVVEGVVRIEGVAQKNGKPIGGVMVALVPKDMSRVELFRRDQSDFDGTFSLPDVVPGTYTVVAVEDAWGSEWMKPGVLEKYVKSGKRVVVGSERGVMRVDAVEVVGK